MECSIVSWCSIPMEAQAAWVQAIFSVVAIFVAILIPAMQRRWDRRERKLLEEREAKALALLLIPTLNVWVEKLSEYSKVLSRHLSAHFPGSVDWNSIADALTLGEQGKQLAPKSHLMGSASSEVQSFFYRLTAAQESAREFGRQRNSEEDHANVAVLLKNLTGVSEAAVAAHASAHRLFQAHPF